MKIQFSLIHPSQMLLGISYQRAVNEIDPEDIIQMFIIGCLLFNIEIILE